MQENRVVVTGLGVIAPNGLGVNAFTQSLQKGQSGIRFIEELAEKKFACQIGGIPPLDETYQDLYLTTFQKNLLVSSSVLYGVLASLEAWKDAGLEVIEKENTDPDWETGCIFGTGLVDGEIIKRTMTMVDNLQVRRLGSTSVTQGMTSAVSAFLGGILGLGNQVTTNASACSTGNEAIMMAYYHIKNGLASRMIAGSSESPGPYIWGGFDSMRLLNRSSNDQPETGSAPMSAHAKGFVPGSGAGALVLESLESAQARGAKIY
ncbi:MAG: beta-ketoacyl-[acyl-carrier-protein] synthase family protein, partial [Bacteroidetes bacterium]|nr:beta-ketoacyl-[acyl-carrier-protein] synthase family protein [Bacteroidota bacterium]